MISEFDIIEPVDSDDDVIATTVGRPSGPTLYVQDPIIIRGAGNMTMFGLSNRFDTDFPQQLVGRVAPEEFHESISRINSILRKSMPLNLRWLLCGCVFCCCTFGCSLWPVVCLNKRTKSALLKLLDYENSHMYNKLGFQWSLSKHKARNSNMTEFVLKIEFLPKMPLLLPD